MPGACGVTAIGNFDGVHLGHQAVLTPALDMARQLDVAATFLSFEPHPRDFFAPQPHLFRLTSSAQKARLARAMGFDKVILAPFDKALASMSAEQFIDDILVAHMQVRAVSVGFDFKFGARRAGTPEMLKKRAEALGTKVHIAPAFAKGDEIVSSSLIRELLRDAELERANRLMGHVFEFEGVVVHGDKRGRELGMPTANIKVPHTTKLAHGIYAVEASVMISGQKPLWINGVANFGIRPMFRIQQPLLEVHLFDFDREIYDQTLRVRFVRYLRAEAKFDGLAPLMAQMQTDGANAKKALDDMTSVGALDQKWRNMA